MQKYKVPNFHDRIIIILFVCKAETEYRNQKLYLQSFLFCLNTSKNIFH